MATTVAAATAMAGQRERNPFIPERREAFKEKMLASQAALDAALATCQPNDLQAIFSAMDAAAALAWPIWRSDQATQYMPPDEEPPGHGILWADIAAGDEWDLDAAEADYFRKCNSLMHNWGMKKERLCAPRWPST